MPSKISEVLSCTYIPPNGQTNKKSAQQLKKSYFVGLSITYFIFLKDCFDEKYACCVGIPLRCRFRICSKKLKNH